MTYNRLNAKLIPGQHCQWCGADDLPLVKTSCCHLWACCDTDYVSFRGGDLCQFEHEHYSICHSHFAEGHSGDWKKCKECLDFWGEDDMDKLNDELEAIPQYLNT